MDKTEKEKEWIRLMSGEKTTQKKPVTPATQPQQGKPSDKRARKGSGFDDVAGMDELKTFVTEGFINVLQNRRCAEAYGIKPPSMLFYGPTGCGKTFFAEKMAEEVGIHFMKVVPDDIASTMVHGTQENIGEVFRNAEYSAPTLLFFDEFDAMVPKRSGEEALRHYDGEVNEFLCMLNNASERGVYVVAATNHPELIDKAVLRTGRIDEVIFIDMPDKEARNSLFSLALSKLPSEENIDTYRLAELTDGYNCSDIDYIVKTAARKMFNATIKGDSDDYIRISQTLLEETIAAKCPSVSKKDMREYERVRSLFSSRNTGGTHAVIGFR